MRIQLPGLEPGATYGIQVRAAQDGQHSPWSQLFEIDVTSDIMAPAVPTGLEWTVEGTAFKAEWGAPTTNQDGSPLKDFKDHQITVYSPSLPSKKAIYYTDAFRFDFPFESNVNALGVPRAAVTIEVRARDNTGNLGLPAIATQTNPAPANVSGLESNGILEAISNRWNAVSDADLKEYQVFMSQSGPSFTTDHTTLVYTGTGTSFVYDTISEDTWYIKVRAVDVFGTPSDDDAISTAAAHTTLSIDNDPPDTPTGFLVDSSESEEDSALANFTVSWNAVVASDLAGYEVRYRDVDTVTYRFVTVGYDSVSTVIPGLNVGTTYEFQVRSVDWQSNASPWSAVVENFHANSAPSKPAAPSLVGDVQSFAVLHDMQKNSGGPLESDVAGIVVYIGITNVWATAAPVKIQTIPTSPGSGVAVSTRIPLPVPNGTASKYIFVTAIDTAGAEGPASNAVAVNVMSLTGAYFEDASIQSAKIANLTVDKLTAGIGIINDLDIKSTLTVGGAAGAGVIRSKTFLNSGGSQGYYLSDNTLIIRDGVIEARALQLQNGFNILHPAYADFEWSGSWYSGKLLTTNGLHALTLTTNKFGLQAVRVTHNASTKATLWLSPSATTYNVGTEQNTKYIVSAFARASTGTPNVTIGYKRADGTTVESTPVATSTGAWTRVYLEIDSLTQLTGAVFVTVANSGVVFFDGVQMEEKTGALSTPSTWKPPALTFIDANGITTGSIQSSAPADGVAGQPAWSINLQGNAQFGDAMVRGRLLIGDPSNPSENSRIQSANYVAGISGWILKNNGRAELRDIEANSLKIVAMDKAMQNTIFTKLYDYMEQGSLWQTRVGTVAALTNETGAYTAKSLLALTGDATVSRDATGVTGGFAFEPESLYKISARVRQITGDPSSATAQKIRIGVLGYDENGVLCGWDGTNDVNKQYYVAAMDDNLTVFDGDPTTPLGWLTFTGFIKGKSSVGTSIAARDEYAPGVVHENVRSLVPYVRMNIGNAIYVAQLDSFMVETFNAGAPVKVSTGGTGLKAVTIEVDSSEPRFDHALHLYSGEADEEKPGLVAHYSDDGFGEAPSMLIAAPVEDKASTNFQSGAMTIHGRTANYLPNSSFVDGISGWTAIDALTIAAADLTADIGFEDNSALKITPTGAFTGTSLIGAEFKLNPQLYPDLIGQDSFTFSAYVNPSRAMAVRARVLLESTDNAGVVTTVTSASSAAVNSPLNEWTRISITVSVPGGAPQTASGIWVRLYYDTAVNGADVLYVDDVMLSPGSALKDYKPAVPSSLYVNADYETVKGSLFVGTSEEPILPPTFQGGQVGVPKYPGVFAQSGGLLIGFTNIQTPDVTYGQRSYGQLSAWDVNGFAGPKVNIYSRSDGAFPNFLSLANADGAHVLTIKDKNAPFDPTVSKATLDIEVAGWLQIKGSPNWATLAISNADWHTWASAYTFGYYNSGQTTFLRGVIENSTGSGTNKAPGTTLCTLPVGSKPAQTIYVKCHTWSSTTDVKILSVSINTAGLVVIASGTALNFISFDNIDFSTSGDTPFTPGSPDVTPPASPTSMTITPLSSSTSTGVYKMTWTGSTSADVFYTRFVWRADRVPAHETDGAVINVPTVQSAITTYNLGNLPVNRTIYIKAYSVDKSGNVSASPLSLSRYLLASPLVINAGAQGWYRDTLGWRTDASTAAQGIEPGTTHASRGLYFYGTAFQTQLQAGSVTRVPTKVTMYLHRFNSVHGSSGKVGADLWGHVYATQPPGAPTMIGAVQLDAVSLLRNTGATFTVDPRWYAGMSTGTVKGFGVWNSGGDFAIFYGPSTNSNHGRLTVYHNG